MTGETIEALVRECGDDDMAAVQAIYADHVRHGLASFEEIPPGLDEMRRRRETVLGLGLPYLVAELDHEVKGFAYLAPYRARSAYRYSVENTVYIATDATRRGLGSRLLEALIQRATDLGYRQMIAVIGDSANAGSIGLHESLGFRTAGLLKSVGFKQGRWVDSVIMQRALGEGDESLPAS